MTKKRRALIWQYIKENMKNLSNKQILTVSQKLQNIRNAEQYGSMLCVHISMLHMPDNKIEHLYTNNTWNKNKT